MDTTRVSLLFRIRDRNDSAAWCEFDAIYRPMLVRFGRASGLNRPEAEEAAQACMAVVAEHAGRFEYDRGKGSFKGWLRTIVNNQLRAARRRQRPQQAKTGDFEAAESREASPEELFERMWLNEHLRYCLDRMRDEVPDSSFRAFDLYVLEKQPVERVCKELNISASQLYRIKWRLTQKLDQKMRTLLDGLE